MYFYYFAIKANKAVDTKWSVTVTGKGRVETTDLRLFEDISGDGVEVSQVFDGRDVLRDGLDHHLAGRQHQLMSSHLTTQKVQDTFNPLWKSHYLYLWKLKKGITTYCTAVLLDDHSGHNKKAALVIQFGKELVKPTDWVTQYTYWWPLADFWRCSNNRWWNYRKHVLYFDE